MTQRLIDLLLRARRRRVQALSFLLMNSYFLQGLKSLPCPGMNCYACPAANLACPIGTLQHFVIIREIPAYRWAPASATRNAREEPIKLDDHAVDAARMGIYTLRRDIPRGARGGSLV